MNSVAEDIINLHPLKVPIIVNTSENSNIELEKYKYIVPKDISLRQFHCILSKKINKNSKQSLILFINNILPSGTDTIGNLYNLHKDNDGFLYITISKENTFG